MADSGFELRMYEDTLPAYRRIDPAPAACHRVIYAFSGSAAVDGDPVIADDACYGAGMPDITAGPQGAVLWRWELARAGAPEAAAGGRGVSSVCKLAARLDTLDPAEPWLLRCDSVAFPPGGRALLHTHQGPGIRCLREGGIRIDSEGRSTRYGVGEPWFEAGPEPVFAQADDMPTRFVRVMVLPRRLLGTSSIRYVRPEDRDRPKDQTYRGYVDVPIER